MSFISDTLQCLYGESLQASALENAIESTDVKDFLNDSGCQLLRFTLCDTGVEAMELRVSNFLAHLDKQQLSGGGSAPRQVHFVKTRQDELTEENIREQVLVHSHRDSPLLSLYETLHSVYAPAILGDPAFNSKLDNNAQQLLMKLERSLGYSLRSSSSRT